MEFLKIRTTVSRETSGEKGASTSRMGAERRGERAVLVDRTKELTVTKETHGEIGKKGVERVKGKEKEQSYSRRKKGEGGYLVTLVERGGATGVREPCR